MVIARIAVEAAVFAIDTLFSYRVPESLEGAVLPDKATRVYESVCNEYINIRKVANPSAEAIGTIPNGDLMTVLAYDTDFCHIQYGDVTGYVNVHFIKPVYPID